MGSRGDEGLDPVLKPARKGTPQSFGPAARTSGRGGREFDQLFHYRSTAVRAGSVVRRRDCIAGTIPAIWREDGPTREPQVTTSGGAKLKSAAARLYRMPLSELPALKALLETPLPSAGETATSKLDGLRVRLLKRRALCVMARQPWPLEFVASRRVAECVDAR